METAGDLKFGVCGVTYGIRGFAVGFESLICGDWLGLWKG